MLSVTLTFSKMSMHWLHFLHGHISSQCSTELAACSSLLNDSTYLETGHQYPLLTARKHTKGSGATAQSSWLKSLPQRNSPSLLEEKLFTPWNRVASTSPEISVSECQGSQIEQCKAQVKSRQENPPRQTGNKL